MGSKPVKLEETVAKKLALWHTRSFRPIMTHNELEPLMAAFGFVALPLAPPPPPPPLLLLPEGQQQLSSSGRLAGVRVAVGGGGARQGIGLGCDCLTPASMAST